MKKLVLLAVVVAAVIIGKRMWERGQESVLLENAQSRVKALLTAAQTGQGANQEAVCQWAVGSPGCAEEILRANSDRYDAWLRAKGGDPLREFSVVSAAVDPSGGGRVKVAVKINGKDQTLIVAKDRPIE